MAGNFIPANVVSIGSQGLILVAPARLRASRRYVAFRALMHRARSAIAVLLSTLRRKDAEATQRKPKKN